MANEPTPKPKERVTTEQQTVNKAATVKSLSINLRVTAGKGAPKFVAGIHFPEGETKTVTVTPERAAFLKRTSEFTVEEIK